jgi:hypothetical protein
MSIFTSRQHLAIAFVNRSGPLVDRRDPQAIELGVAMMSLVDLDAGDGMAMALVGQSVELAIAAIGARAIDEFAPLEFPHRHGCLHPFEDALPTTARRADERFVARQLCKA